MPVVYFLAPLTREIMSYPLTDEHRVLNELKGWQTAMKDWVVQSIQRMDDQAARIAQLEETLASGAAATAKPKHIEMPPFENVTKLALQIFHTPDFKPNPRDKSGKSEWSAKLSVFANGRRIGEPNISLNPGRKFYYKVMDRLAPPPPHTLELAEALEGSDDIWAGMPRVNTDGRGAPYLWNMVLLLGGHLTADPFAEFHYDGHRVEFPPFRSGAGEKKGKALWFSQWLRKSDAA